MIDDLLLGFIGVALFLLGMAIIGYLAELTDGIVKYISDAHKRARRRKDAYRRLKKCRLN